MKASLLLRLPSLFLSGIALSRSATPLNLTNSTDLPKDLTQITSLNATVGLPRFRWNEYYYDGRAVVHSYSPVDTQLISRKLRDHFAGRPAQEAVESSRITLQIQNLVKLDLEAVLQSRLPPTNAVAVELIQHLLNVFNIGEWHAAAGKASIITIGRESAFRLIIKTRIDYGRHTQMSFEPLDYVGRVYPHAKIEGDATERLFDMLFDDIHERFLVHGGDITVQPGDYTSVILDGILVAIEFDNPYGDVWPTVPWEHAIDSLEWIASRWEGAQGFLPAWIEIRIEHLLPDVAIGHLRIEDLRGLTANMDDNDTQVEEIAR